MTRATYGQSGAAGRLLCAISPSRHVARSRAIVLQLYTSCLSLLLYAGCVSAGNYAQSPFLDERVASRALPPVVERVPAQPLVRSFAEMGLEQGRYGGDLRLLMARSKDVRLMVVYGYARLVGFDTDYSLKPDILRDIEVEEGRRFTLRLRKGHRWSDGHPFTAEDFRYFWEDIVNNDELSAFGVPAALLVEGERPEFEVVDELTVRYTWTRPNPFFLPALAGTRPTYIYAPSHYMRQFHIRYTDPGKLERLAKKEGQRGWVALHTHRLRPYKSTNVDLPSLQPWINTTPPPSDRFVFERNPYFHRMDESGRQLPYIDRVIMNIADGKLIAAKTGAGESDLQARNLSFSDYTFLKESEKRTRNKVLLWPTTKGAHMALYPNLNAKDETWRALMRDVRFRRALSLAVNRREINQVIYYGLAIEGNNTVVPDCPLYEPKYRSSWTSFDLDYANDLLDELGLTERNDDGLRLLPDGRPMEIIIETAGEDTEQSDVLELIRDSWLGVGIKVYTKPLQREVFRNRIFSGQTIMSVWFGLENGLPTADMSPRALAPTSQQQLQWPMWGQFYETKGSVGEAVDLSEAKKLLTLQESWLDAATVDERADIWRTMLNIHAEQLYSLGLVAGVPQPVVVNDRLRNVPEKGVYNWEPGAHFGIYRLDAMWFAAEE